jgi:hypothetical protein
LVGVVGVWVGVVVVCIRQGSGDIC